MNKWYSKPGNTLLDKILAHHDLKKIMIKIFCAPVNVNGFHWVVMDVTMPNDQYFNGKVLLTNHAYDGSCSVQHLYRRWDLKYSSMWWAKWFGMYNKQGVMNKILEKDHGWNDLHIESYSDDGNKSKKLLESSSLDHDARGSKGMGIQTDGHNCGVWALMELFNRKEGFNKPIGPKTEKELDDYRLKMFNVLIQIYELHNKTNDWLFKWRDYGGIKNRDVWRGWFSRCSQGRYDRDIFLKRYKLYQERCEEIKAQREWYKGTSRTKSIDRFKDVDIDACMKLGVWSHWMEWNTTDAKERLLKLPSHINFDEYLELTPDLNINRDAKKIVQIGKRAIKIGNSHKFVSLIPTIQNFLLNIFVGKTEEQQLVLKNHINECMIW